jgi:HSP20 family molecular chaperone IbpA
MAFDLGLSIAILRSGETMMITQKQSPIIQHSRKPFIFQQETMSSASFPNLDISETKSHYVLRVDVTSLLGANVDIELTADDLIISSRGARRSANSNPTLSLKVNSLDQVIAARYSHGFLEIALPKKVQNKIRQNSLFQEAC